MEIVDREQRLRHLRGGLVDPQQHVAADHHPRQPLLGRALAVDRVDPLPAPQNRDPIGDLQHLVQLVGDEDDRHALIRQGLEDLEQLARLLRGQHRRGLVEDQDVRGPVEGFQDLDPLLLADGDRLHSRAGVDCEVEGLRELGHPPVRGSVVEQDARVRRFCREHDVLGNGHHRNQHEVLVDHADPVIDRILRRMQTDRLPLDQNLALVGVVEAVEDVHESRFPGAVLPEEGVHLAATEIEVDAVVCDDPGKSLRDPAELENRSLVNHAAVILGGGTAPAP